jgi:hypothetical protein
MSSFILGKEYCRRTTPIGKFTGTKTLEHGKYKTIYSEFDNKGALWTIHPSENSVIHLAPCPLKGGKTRRRRNRKQRKTRRY